MATAVELIPSLIHFIKHNIMIITLTIILIDFLVLIANDIPYLPLHCLYLAYLTVVLRYRKQPSSYVLSAEQSKEILEKKKIKYLEQIPECSVCLKSKPLRYYHCRHCSRCIYKLDHHCNFVDNCIGQHNFKVYVHFLVNAFLHSLAVTAIIAWNCKKLFDFSSKQALYWFLLLPGLFGIYQDMRLLLAFWTTIKRNQTLIQSYKLVRGPKKITKECFYDYFGNNMLKWLLPTFVADNSWDLLEPTFPLSEQQQIKEYTYADEYIYGGDDEDDDDDEMYQEDKRQ